MKRMPTNRRHATIPISHAPHPPYLQVKRMETMQRRAMSDEDLDALKAKVGEATGEKLLVLRVGDEQHRRPRQVAGVR